MIAADSLSFDDVSKFYGEVLGVNRVTLEIPPGITGLVGPNGSGKTTLMNLMTGLLQPSRGRLRILGDDLSHPERTFRKVGYCTQFDSFPRAVTGREFLYSTLRLHGYGHGDAHRLTEQALGRVGLHADADRRVAGYSKGMRQRIRLGQAIAHEPPVLVLDEPLNGLDPLARAEVIELFRDWGSSGRHLIVSSHILHEIDMLADRVILLQNGYVVAEGETREMRGEMRDHPLQVLVRSDRPWRLAARLFEEEHVVEIHIQDDRRGVLVRTRAADQLFPLLNRIILDEGLTVERITPTDQDVGAVYGYLVESESPS